jgi:hypothetical protein
MLTRINNVDYYPSTITLPWALEPCEPPEPRIDQPLWCESGKNHSAGLAHLNPGVSSSSKMRKVLMKAQMPLLQREE